MSTILQTVLDKLAEASEALDKKRQAIEFLTKVDRLAKKCGVSDFFIVADGGSMTRNHGNSAVANARKAHIAWEKEHGEDPNEDWLKSSDKKAGYDQKGSHNNNYKGPGKRGYSADHKAVEKTMKAVRCSRCGSTENVQRAEVHGSHGKRHIALCRACHAKYDKAYKNLKG